MNDIYNCRTEDWTNEPWRDELCRLNAFSFGTSSTLGCHAWWNMPFTAKPTRSETRNPALNSENNGLSYRNLFSIRYLSRWLRREMALCLSSAFVTRRIISPFFPHPYSLSLSLHSTHQATATHFSWQLLLLLLKWRETFEKSHPKVFSVYH